jgi:hypothetical protein
MGCFEHELAQRESAARPPLHDLRWPPVSDPLYLPRRLAIRLLAAAQNAADEKNVHGYIGAQDGEPATVYPEDEDALAQLKRYGETLWACYRSHAAPPAPKKCPRELEMSVDTKGVLQLRCWELVKGKRAERDLKIKD